MPVEGIPYTPHALIHTGHRLPRPLQLLTTRTLQQLRLFQDFAWLHAPHTDGPLLAIDVRAANDGVAARTRRDGDFDAGVLAGEGRQGGGEEGVHAFAAAGPVAVVEVE